MTSSFDKFSRFEVPLIYVCSPGCRLNNGILTSASGILFNASDIELNMNWNAVSELNLRVNKITLEDSNEDAQFQSTYKTLKNRRVLYLDGVGFFIITNVEEGYSNGLSYKDITAESCEVEIQDRNVPYIPEGTYKFWTGSVTHNADGSIKWRNDSGEAVTGLIDALMYSLNLWTLDTTSLTTAVKNRYRTFDEVSTDRNILSFMLDEVQEAYEIIFDFDVSTRVITATDQSAYASGRNVTDIHLTKDDLIESVNITEGSEDLYTALAVYGEDDITINAVNPLATSVLYDFSYYTDWMTMSSTGSVTINGVVYNYSTLGEHVELWQKDIENSQSDYYTKNTEYYSLLNTLSIYKSEKSKIETRLGVYEKCRNNIVAASEDVDIDKYNQVLTDAGIIAPAFSEGSTYDVCAYVTHDNYVYKCHTAVTTAGAWTGSANWTQIYLSMPEDSGYIWMKYASDTSGTGITDDPKEKNYIGLLIDQTSRIESSTASSYSGHWYTYRSFTGFKYDDSDENSYVWLKFADSITGDSVTMYDSPDYTDSEGNVCDRIYAGIAIKKSSATKSSTVSDYTWTYIAGGSIGAPEVLASIVTMINGANTELITATANVSATQTLVDNKKAEIDAISNRLKMAAAFTQAELTELQNYIFEGTYTDEYVTITDSMTQSERLEQMNILYSRGVNQLSKISKPTQEFDVDVENFIFVEAFSKWSSQLHAGCVINVELEEGDVAALFLTAISVNYDDKKLTLTFGNRLNRTDPKALFEDALGSVKKSANTLSYIKDTVSVLNDGTFNAMQEALNTSRTLTKSLALSAANEAVIIDDTGYTGARVVNDETGELDVHQIKINGRNIVFTDDAWETCKTAVGEILLADGTSAYGINAEILLGDVIMGNELHIINEDGEDMFTVTKDEVLVSVGESYTKKEDAVSDVDVFYCRTTSNVLDPDTNPETIEVAWSTVAPAWVNGKYIWQKTKTTYDDGDIVYSAATCLTGSKGETGESGEGISSYKIEYAVSDSGSVAPTASEDWSDIFPSSIGDNEFLWTRTTLNYDDGSTSQSLSVSSSATGISSIQEEYYLSSSSSTQTGGSWSTTTPAWVSGSYIWTRSRIYWTNGTETTTTPVLDNTLNNIGATVDTCVTDIAINKTGIQQNTLYYQELYNQISKINAYIQTGVISIDETGKTTYGVKIGETLSSIDVYIVSGSQEFSSGWLSTTEGGSALTPQESVLYTIKTAGQYYGRVYRWIPQSGSTDGYYEETSSDGTLSSIFTSNELGFYDTGEKTAYFSNKNLNVKTVRTNKILLSEDVIQNSSENNWQIGIDNGFYLKWIGD